MPLSGQQIFTSGDKMEDKKTPKRKVDLSMLGVLRDKIPPDHTPFDIRKFREEGYDPALRD